MDVFGGAWIGYMEKLKEGLSVLRPDDTLVLLGDLSWSLDLQGAKEDFAWIHQIPGRKIILKGNHDYWWNTVTKMKKFLEEKKFKNIDFIYNQGFIADNYIITGTRGWSLLEEDKDEK